MDAGNQSSAKAANALTTEPTQFMISPHPAALLFIGCSAPALTTATPPNTCTCMCAHTQAYMHTCTHTPFIQTTAPSAFCCPWLQPLPFGPSGFLFAFVHITVHSPHMMCPLLDFSRLTSLHSNSQLQTWSRNYPCFRLGGGPSSLSSVPVYSCQASSLCGPDLSLWC